MKFKEPPESDSDSAQLASTANTSRPLALSGNTSTPYIIGGKTLKAPLVTIEQLKAHLYLLRAFKDLRTIVEASPKNDLGKFQPGMSEWPELVKKMDGPSRWVWFLGIAVDRFHAWVQARKRNPDQPPRIGPWLQEECPPIDVIMVWHTYLLNPLWYTEDCDHLNLPNTLFKASSHVNGTEMLLNPRILLKAIHLGLKISSTAWNSAHESWWTTNTSTAFDPFLAAAHAETRDIDCPHCLKQFSVPRLKDDGTGYSQARFIAKCPQCNTDGITKEHLGILKFARDAVLDESYKDDYANYGLGCYLAGTLGPTLQRENRKGAAAMKAELLKTLGFDDIDPEQKRNCEVIVKHIIEYSGWQALPHSAHRSLEQSRIKRMMSAYTDDMPSSIDLVGAVLHQCSFIDKMHDLGWTNPTYFNGNPNEAVLTDAISRYHAFLDLWSSSRNTPHLIPTLDIDLVWHTHQMLNATYHSNCLTYVGRYIDHPDKIEGKEFADAFDDTCRAWKRRFGVPYTYCGCPPPGVTIRNCLKVTFGGTSRGRVLQTPQTLNARAATHVSEHNAVFAEDALRRACSGCAYVEVQQQLERADRETSSVGTACAKTVRNGNADTKTVYNGNMETETLCHEKADTDSLCDGDMDAEEEHLCDGQTDMDAETLCDEKTDTANVLQW